MRKADYLSRRRLLSGAATAAVSAALPSAVIADTPWPTKPVKVVVPYSPGGAADAISRLIF